MEGSLFSRLFCFPAFSWRCYTVHLNKLNSSTNFITNEWITKCCQNHSESRYLVTNFKLGHLLLLRILFMLDYSLFSEFKLQCQRRVLKGGVFPWLGLVYCKATSTLLRESFMRFLIASLSWIFLGPNHSLSHGCYNNKTVNKAWSGKLVVTNHLIQSK